VVPIVSRYGPGDQQFGQLWLPDGEGQHPIAVLIHGGAWRAPYRLDLMEPLAADLAGRGFAAWNLEYRRVGSGGGYPATLHDVTAGCAALAGLAKAHRLDAARLVLIGHSAGGQLALWAAARVRPACAVSLAGMIDLRTCHALGTCGGAAAEFLGGTPDELPERYATASPAELLPLGVPQVLVHGTADVDVEPSITDTYAALATAAGDVLTILRPDRVDHFDVIDPATPIWAATVDAVWETLAPCR
jgi:acetyl esterase/lipase